MFLLRNFIKTAKNILKGKSDKINSLYVCETATTKRALNSACSLTLSSACAKKKDEADKKTELLLKKYGNNPQKLLQYVKMHGVKVYTIANVDKILSSINEEEGFITPLKGRKALFLNFVIGLFCENKIKIGFKTDEMMLFASKEIDYYLLVRAIYKYHGYKNNLPGYDYKSQEIFKKIYNTKNSNKTIDNASFNDLCACREALVRDLESINFTVKLSVEYENSKKALQKLKETNSINV